VFALKAPRCFDGEAFRAGGVTVLVEGERIVGVEPLAYDVPDGCEVTSYDGTLLPGLVDCHVHLVADAGLGSLERAGTATDDELDAVIRQSLAQQAAGGVTTVRDLGDIRFRALVARDRRTPGEPRIVAAGPPLTAESGHCHFLGGSVTGVDEARAAVVAHAARGADVIKVMASGGMLTFESDVFGVQFPDDELAAIVTATHDSGLRILAHSHSEAGIRQAVAAGVDGLEHVTCLTEDGPSVPRDLFEEIAARGITVDPTLGLDPSRLPAPDQFPPAMRAMLERYQLTPSTLLEVRTAQVALARSVGVRVVTGLDAGATPAKPHGAVWRAVAQLAGAGYSPAEALATATSAAADDCGLGRTTGRLATSYAADLLVVDGDLAADLTALGRPLQVVVRGEPVR
jgi:imidazolonepropionase-like amidohydrolase